MKCNFCNKDKKHLIKKNNLCICNDCTEQFVNVFLNNKLNIKLKIKDFKIKKVK